MKHLLITGASGNLGRELIKYLNFDKYEKIYLVVNLEKLNQIDIEKSKFKIFSDFDLASEDSVKQIFNQINVLEHDELFVIHLVGGYTGGKLFWEFDAADLKLMINKNLISSFLISKYTAKKLLNGSGGSIFFISARLSIHYEPKRSVYAISKSALNFLLKVIEIEGNDLNLTVNAAAPKVILTEENKKWIAENEYHKHISPQQLAKQIEFVFEDYQRYNGNIFLVND